MTIWRNGSNRWTAKFAALLFVVQALLVGFTLGAHAAPVLRDQFGHVICATAPDGSMRGGSSDAGHHAGLIDCCQLGCSMAGGDVPPPQPQVSVRVSLAQALQAPFRLAEDIGSGVLETPRRTRAPPISL